MARNDINNRLSELGIYNDYYYRREIKPLSQIINIDEQINCIFTGVNDGMRRLVAITSYRIIIIGAPTLGQVDMKVIRRGGVKSYSFKKKFLVSSVVIETEESKFEFHQVQAARQKLFNWAMEQNVKEFDE